MLAVLHISYFVVQHLPRRLLMLVYMQVRLSCARLPASETAQWRQLLLTQPTSQAAASMATPSTHLQPPHPVPRVAPGGRATLDPHLRYASTSRQPPLCRHLLPAAMTAHTMPVKRPLRHLLRLRSRLLKAQPCQHRLASCSPAQHRNLRRAVNSPPLPTPSLQPSPGSKQMPERRAPLGA